MYVFGLVALLGLGVLAFVMWFDRFMRMFRWLWSVAFVGLGVAVAWIAGFDLFELWGVDARAGWIGITLTGLMIGGVAYFWRESIGLIVSLVRKLSDEAEDFERTHNLSRVA